MPATSGGHTRSPRRKGNQAERGTRLGTGPGRVTTGSEVVPAGAAWLAADGRLEDAARCLGIVQSIRDRLTMVIPPYEDRTFIVEEAGLAVLDPERREAAFTEGRAMEPTEGIDWVLDALTALDVSA